MLCLNLKRKANQLIQSKCWVLLVVQDRYVTKNWFIKLNKINFDSIAQYDKEQSKCM